ncbi:hypothetical protein LOK49_LG10G01455, partial [Camellia lanceoleosa]
DELYEYSKVLGNTRFILLPFQPYKFVYAHIFVLSSTIEISGGRAQEVDTWRQLVSSLEERIRTHQQYISLSLILGKLLNLFDSTVHRVVGGLPHFVPSTSRSFELVNIITKPWGLEKQPHPIRQGKASASSGVSRFGHFSFGSQLLQKTVGLVLKPRQDKQSWASPFASERILPCNETCSSSMHSLYIN